MMASSCLPFLRVFPKDRLNFQILAYMIVVKSLHIR